MAYRWRGRFFRVDAEDPQAEGICARCNFRFNLADLQWQYAYQGTNVPQNTRFLVCGRPGCLDPLNPQDTPIILPPDPLPVYNARPEPYALDEASWLSTEDGDIIVTEDEDPITVMVPNPADNAATAHLATTIRASGGSVAVAYLDIFNGNPATTGVSVLAAITGSATRSNIAADLTTVSGIAKNPDQIVVALESGATTNANYAAIYDAASGGTLLMSGPLNTTTGQSITEGNPVLFDGLAIQINLN